MFKRSLAFSNITVCVKSEDMYSELSFYPQFEQILSRNMCFTIWNMKTVDSCCHITKAYHIL